MTAQAKRRSAPKAAPQCQCQEQIKEILTRFEVLEADKPKFVCVMKPASAESLRDTYEQMTDFTAESMRVMLSPPNPERERILNKMHRKLIAHDVAHEIAQSLPPKRRKQMSKKNQ